MSPYPPYGAPGGRPVPELCPYCRATSGVQSTSAPPGVQAWTCTACETNGAITTVNPKPGPAYFDQLGAAVEEIGRLRWKLAQVVALADEAVALTDQQLRHRLLALTR